MGLAAGIGFTVSIFLAGLAFESYAVTDLAKIGILVASFIAAVAALLLMRFGGSSSTIE
jgi:NhaA family Na+:H+ antiporter